jgi:hypothetical protein
MPSRAALAAGRVLHDARFWFSLGGLAVLLGLGCLARHDQARRLAAALAGLLALAELGWAGYSVIRVAPAKEFLGTDPVGATIARLASSSAKRDFVILGGRGSVRAAADTASPVRRGGSPSPNRARRFSAGPVRIKARDSCYGDLRAVAAGLEKTNINDLFQLDRPARLYETLYRATALPRPHRAALPMSEPAAQFERHIRQAVFDRMSVSYLVSDRFEPDPGWPVAGSGCFDGRPFVVQRNPTALPRGYVVPRACVVNECPSVILSLFRALDARETVIMDHDPLAGVDDCHRQRFTPIDWISHDPDHPVLRVATHAPGLLVVADTWMPGWTATIDGRAVPILQGNLAQRVIPILRPGSHTIALDYNAPGLAVGGVITASSVLLWLALFGATLLGRRAASGFSQVPVGFKAACAVGFK